MDKKKEKGRGKLTQLTKQYLTINTIQ